MKVETLDAINGSYELLGAIFQCLNVRKIYKDKMIKGVHWGSVLFFTTWGWFNMIYYPSLHQVYSTIGAIALTLVNTVWISQIFYYQNIKSNV